MRIRNPGDLKLVEGKVTAPRLERHEYPKGLSLTRWANTQLCQRLQIPPVYFRRCPTELQDRQANHWLAVQEEARMRDPKRGSECWLLRAQDERLRGVLSDRYAPLDHPDLLEMLLPVLEKRFEVGWFALTSESLHLRLFDPTLTQEAFPGDRLVAGLHIANSEVGRRAITLDAMIYRLVCTNGLVRLVKGKSLLYRRHLNFSRDQFAFGLKNAVQEALRESVAFLERMRWATNERVPQMEQTLERLSRVWGLSKALTQALMDALCQSPRSQQDTLYGLVNALTFIAQTLPADTRYTLEVLAGQLLETGVPASGLLALPPLPLDLERGRTLFSDLEEEEEAQTKELVRVPLAA